MNRRSDISIRTSRWPLGPAFSRPFSAGAARASAGLVTATICLLSAIAPASAADIDTSTSHISFKMTTRWGQPLDGSFPDYRGEVAERADGRHQVRLQLDTGTVEITGHRAYTRFARGNGFFDTDNWPHVDFVSDAYAPAMLRDGGTLAGQLTIRGVKRHEVFTIQPSSCARPGLDCDVIATGTVQRSDYGMTRWNFAFSGDVVFELRIRIREPVDR